MILKAEAGEAARKLSMMSDARAAELETKLQNCRADKDTMHLRLEEASQVLGVFIYASWGMGTDFARFFPNYEVFYDILSFSFIMLFPFISFANSSLYSLNTQFSLLL